MEHTSNRYPRRKGLLVPVLLIAIGAVLLLEKTGLVESEMLSQWWPLLPIFAGGWLLLTRMGRNTKD